MPVELNLICFFQVLATSSRKNTGNNLENDPLKGPDGETKPEFGEDDENMVSVTRNIPGNGYPQIRDTDKQLRYRTRIFAAEYVCHYSCNVILNDYKIYLINSLTLP